jgi:hypothetical protein
MTNDTNSWQAFRRWLAIVIGAGYIGYAIPRNINAEKAGIYTEGVVVGYKASFSGRYSYPIVRVTWPDRELELKSTESWYWRWYGIGSRVPVIYSPGGSCLVGTRLLRWSDVFVASGAVAALSILSFSRARRK